MHITLTALIYNDLTIGAKGERPDFNSQHAGYTSDINSFYVLIGRKTFEAMGSKPFGKRMFVLTRNCKYTAEGITPVLDIAAFILMATEDSLKEINLQKEVIIFGGAQTFHATMPWADRLCITNVMRGRAGEMKFPQYPDHLWHCPCPDARTDDEDGVVIESRSYYRKPNPYPHDTLEEQAMFKTMNISRAKLGLTLITRALPE